MENNNGTNPGNKGSKAGNILQKLYHFRLKVDRKGTPIVNVSSLFGLACLIFAPHMTIVGVVASLLLGYQIRFESEDDDGQIQETIRKAADNIKTGAVNAARSIQKEINKVRTDSAPAPAAQQEPAKAAAPAAPSNEELLQDLQAKAAEPMESNPAATTFHSAYAASAGSVPVLRVDETPAGTPEPSAPAARSQE